MEDLKFQTKDCYASCILRASGIPLEKLTKENGKVVKFHFNSSSATCEKILQEHWDRSLQLQTRLLIETINELKSRMYEVLYEKS